MATVNSGDTITAAQYNDLQSRTNNIMGTGSGNSGYGQTLTSAQVSTGNTVTAAQMDNLRTDINKANTHQSGSGANIGNIAVGQVIGADASGTSVGSLTQTTEGYNDYDAAVTLITTNKFLLDSGQGSLENISSASSSRTTNWSNEIQHVFTIDFGTANNARFFFNSGSDIRISLSQTGGSGSKTTSWRNLLSGMGTVKINHTTTTVTGSASTNATGWYDMTTSYKTLVTDAVGGGGVYAENNLIIQGRRNSGSTTLQVRIRLIDADSGDQQPGFLPGPGLDESVTGTITSTVQRFRATGTNVEVTAPSGSNNTLLTAGS